MGGVVHLAPRTPTPQMATSAVHTTGWVRFCATPPVVIRRATVTPDWSAPLTWRAPSGTPVSAQLRDQVGQAVPGLMAGDDSVRAKVAVVVAQLTPSGQHRDLGVVDNGKQVRSVSRSRSSRHHPHDVLEEERVATICDDPTIRKLVRRLP